MVTRRVVSAPAPVARSTMVTRVTPGAGLSGRPSLCQINPTILSLPETVPDGSRPSSPERPHHLRRLPARAADGRHQTGRRLSAEGMTAVRPRTDAMNGATCHAVGTDRPDDGHGRTTR